MEEQTVVRWLLVHEPDLFIFPKGCHPVPIDELKQIKGMNKTEFFQTAEALASKNVAPQMR